jgi:PAS domain S-box-containing protein
MNQSIRILHLEDDAADAELVEAILESAGMVCQITRVQTGDEFSEALRQGGYDVILADYRLPTYDGMSALRLAQQLALYVPFIFVSGTMGEDAAIDGLTEGATDYVLKDKLTRLEPAVKRALRDAENWKERKLAEAEVAHLTHEMKLILNSAGEGIFGTDVEGNVTFVNPAMARMVGWEISELLGQPTHDLWHHTRPDGQPYPLKECPMRLAFQNGCTYHTDDELFWRKDGTSFPVEYTSTPIREGDRMLGTVVVIKDISARKQAEEALRRSERKNTILNQIAKIFLTAPDDEMYAEVHVVVLQAIKSKFGVFGFIAENGDLVIPSLSRDIWNECQVSDKSAIFPPASWGESLWGKAIREKSTFNSDGPFHTPDGHIHIDHFLTVPAVFGDRTIGLISVANKEGGYTEEDKSLLESIAGYISPILNARLQRDWQEQERKRAEEELKRTEARRRELERGLIQAQKLESLGTLASGIAHDFNNVLSAIFGYSEMAIAKIPEDSPYKYHIEQVLKAAERARDLVKQILTFSRQSEQELRPVQITLLLKEVLKFLRASIPTTIAIRQKITCSPESMILADPTQIHQVIMNLCTNALHAMGQGKGILEIQLFELVLSDQDYSLYPQLDPGSYLCLKVSDTGCGMDEKTMQRIFDPFFTTKSREEGTGMGLAVVYGIVKTCGGTITVESRPGEGSHFCLYFPKVVSAVPECVTEPREVFTGKGRVLFVDDEEPLTILGKIMIESLGYSVLTKTSSLEALEMFRSRPDEFDLLITDYTMPDMTGIDLAKEVRQIRANMPVILCTGLNDFLKGMDIAGFGVQELIYKPINRRVISRAIKHILQIE